MRGRQGDGRPAARRRGRVGPGIGGVSRPVRPVVVAAGGSGARRPVRRWALGPVERTNGWQDRELPGRSGPDLGRAAGARVVGSAPVSAIELGGSRGPAGGDVPDQAGVGVGQAGARVGARRARALGDRRHGRRPGPCAPRATGRGSCHPRRTGWPSASCPRLRSTASSPWSRVSATRRFCGCCTPAACGSPSWQRSGGATSSRGTMPARSPSSATVARRAWCSYPSRCGTSSKASAVAPLRRQCSGPAAVGISTPRPWSASSRRPRRARGSSGRSRRTGCGMRTSPTLWSASARSTWCRPPSATPRWPPMAGTCTRDRQIVPRATWPCSVGLTVQMPY